MPVYRLTGRLAFPDPSEAEPDGLLAAGGDLSVERLLLAYSCGIFPWHGGPPILWYAPDPRAVLPPARLHVPQRLRRTLRRGGFTVTLDAAFREVVEACAAAPRPGQDGTWITPDMVDAYTELHRQGLAHSAEAWRDGRLVGGVYGPSLGSAFFGESMFHRERDASKVALVALVWQLDAWGFTLFDAQLQTPHLVRFGVEPWPRARFQAALAEALERPTRRGRWTLDPGLVDARAGAD
ncbi:MAG TPA: leucyl/phenylalanyl-tRNA--protein transferase [Myxococcota bacterium]|nr:leucyl/phenylalanyl-tRNA--protein transferase [Myxococcota bacterium]